MKMRNKGITIITLVITIIVILILAGVTIVTLTESTGVLTKAIEAKNKSESASIEEKIKLELMASKINENGDLNDIQLENAIEQLEQNLTIDSYEKGDSDALIKFVLKKGDYAYEIDRNGKMLTSGADRNQRFADSVQTAYKGLSIIKNVGNRSIELLQQCEIDVYVEPSLIMEIEAGLNEIYNIGKNTKVYNKNILDGLYTDELILNNKKLTLDLTGIEIEQIKLENGNYSEVSNKLEALLSKIDDKLSEVEKINKELNSKKIYGNNKILTNEEEIRKIESILNKTSECIFQVNECLNGARERIYQYMNDPEEAYIQDLKKEIKRIDDSVKSITEDGKVLFDGNYSIKYNLNNQNRELKFGNLTVKGLKLNDINYANLEPNEVMNKIDNAQSIITQNNVELSSSIQLILYYLY